MGILLGRLTALPGRAVVGVAEVLGTGQLQDDADAAVFHGEDDGGQIALGGVGEARRRRSGRTPEAHLRLGDSLTHRRPEPWGQE